MYIPNLTLSRGRIKPHLSCPYPLYGAHRGSNIIYNGPDSRNRQVSIRGRPVAVTRSLSTVIIDNNCTAALVYYTLVVEADLRV